MNNVFLRHFVNGADNSGQQFGSLSFVMSTTETLDSEAHTYFLEAVAEAALGVLTDALECRLMMSHIG